MGWYHMLDERSLWSFSYLWLWPQWKAPKEAKVCSRQLLANLPTKRFSCIFQGSPEWCLIQVVIYSSDTFKNSLINIIIWLHHQAPEIHMHAVQRTHSQSIERSPKEGHRKPQHWDTGWVGGGGGKNARISHVLPACWWVLHTDLGWGLYPACDSSFPCFSAPTRCWAQVVHSEPTFRLPCRNQLLAVQKRFSEGQRKRKQRLLSAAEGAGALNW